MFLNLLYFIQRVDELEAKVLEVSSGFERQVDVNETSKCLVKKAVGAVCQNNEQMKDLENELATGEVIRDTLRREKLKVRFHLCFC